MHPARFELCTHPEVLGEIPISDTFIVCSNVKYLGSLKLQSFCVERKVVAHSSKVRSVRFSDSSILSISLLNSMHFPEDSIIWIYTEIPARLLSSWMEELLRVCLMHAVLCEKEKLIMGGMSFEIENR